MLVFKRIRLLVLIFSFLFAIGMDVSAHFVHDWKIPEIEFTSDPKISCNIDGTTFINVRELDIDGNVLRDTWLYEEYPRAPVVKIEAESHGFGWAHILLYGNIDDEPFGDIENTHEQRLGTWVGFAPIIYGIDNKPFWEEYGSFNTDPKEYPWNGSGSIDLVPVYWKWRWSGKGIGGSWEDKSDKEWRETKSDSTSGSWKVELYEGDIETVTYNNTYFSVYETLEVTVSKSDLYMATMEIAGKYITAYASDRKLKLRYTFNSGDIGKHKVKVTVWYRPSGESESVVHRQAVHVGVRQ